MHTAIGQVVTESAEFEAAVLNALYVVLRDEAILTLFGGQGMDQLMVALGIAVRETTWSYGPDHKKLVLIALNYAGRLRDKRNFVVHSTWSESCLLDTQCELLDSESVEGGRVYHLLRGRRNRDLTERRCTVADLERLAGKFKEARGMLNSAVDFMNEELESRFA